MLAKEAGTESLAAPHRVRHITSIQIRHFTPFPSRDAALTQPTEQPHFTADDLELGVTRRRQRRVSQNSVASLSRSIRSEDGESADGRGRRRTGSRVSFQTTGSAPKSPTHHQRTESMSSAASALDSGRRLEGSHPVGASMLGHSQAMLARIINSRLTETFIALSIPDAPSPAPEKLPTVEQRRNTLRETPLASRMQTHNRSASTLSSAARSKAFPKQSPTLAAFPTSPSPPTSPLPTSSTLLPCYLSPVHEPSTNPSFAVDPKYEFAPWADTSSGRCRVEVFFRPPPDAKGKGRAGEWRVLQAYDFSLDDLVEDNGVRTPPNTLVLKLDPPGKLYYLPSPTYHPLSIPDPGYSSDPEGQVIRQLDTPPPTPRPDGERVVSRRRHHHPHREQSCALDDDRVVTGTWHDLFKLVTLQSGIYDHEEMLEEIRGSIAGMLNDDQGLHYKKREISERESRVDELRVQCAGVRKSCNEARQEIDARREELRQRRQLLAEAYEQDLHLVDGARDALENHVETERTLLADLRAQIPPLQTTHLLTLSSIFPIELVSPPDLLYTIVDVPLPIPVLPGAASPPLSLPHYRKAPEATHQDVNEESVATALGYAAQVVKLIAEYLGQGLMYPVTCVGSRSLIRDGISAMVGPRMFPLFSRGVDTYRFEYGVFLLNKDIELLMSERDLRALDMRHTLPNLKNLLLTLTSGEAAHVPYVVLPPTHIDISLTLRSAR
ncbi:UV radiation resistance protein and autophagy-related subunit 14-domain-containing protein [Schizophyllum amplum]|uniref:Autophagy-related protein 14 n=1 Tax=Schizophyllum amplum TaxID=97359 RepID=A0A550CDI2_9AGAR|nr:UV radiation resistance protein and autophagy-related subunit 14-domain-containing protein [Auriculariopsis ampla]